MPAKISILIANYNNGKYFHDCWESLLSQTVSDWEAVIVDDCSTDDSLSLITHIIAGDARAKIVINDKNFGCGYTKRRCAELGSGELFAFVDPDDALEPNALSVMQEIFDKKREIVLAYSKYIRCDENLKSMGKEYTQAEINSKDPYFFNLGGTISHFSVFRSSAYKKTEGIDPYMLRAVDQDLYFKLCEQGETKGVNEYLYKYRLHSNGISIGTGAQNITKAEYWHWYAINAAAKRRGVYVENLYTDFYINKSVYNALYKDHQMILNSGSYQLAQKLSKLKAIFSGKK